MAIPESTLSQQYTQKIQDYADKLERLIDRLHAEAFRPGESVYQWNMRSRLDIRDIPREREILEPVIDILVPRYKVVGWNLTYEMKEDWLRLEKIIEKA
jgi:hypothetical protein